MKPVVMKFGGTSVEDATAIQRTGSIVHGRLHRGQHPVVVVSAMAKVTDQLLAAAKAAGRGDRSGALAISARLRHRHCDTSALLVPAARQPELQNWIQQEFESIDEILRGLSAVGELTPRTNDLVVSFGERLSSRLVAEAFGHLGIPATHVDARTCIITDAQHGKAMPNAELIEARCQQYLRPLVEAGQVPVMGGFIGSTVEGATTTLGRGGSDYTAALIGGGLNAEAIEIWTDVNGIMTADPRVCPDALRVKTISFEEAAELAYFGAKVLHPATILPAVQKNIPVLVLNSRNAENEGTRITALAVHGRSPFKSIAAKRRLTIIDMVASRMLMSHGYLRAVFEVFDKYKCAVDMVSTSEVSVSLTVDSNEQLPELAADLSKLADVTYEGRKALICLVGSNIRGQQGIAAQVFNAVRHINVRMISQGASEINMSFMIDEDDVDEAVRSLHAAFFVDPDPEIFDGHEDRKRAFVTMIFLVLGRGKTGQVVADIAHQRGHSVRVIGEEENPNASALTGPMLAGFDAIIDFTTPQAVIPNMRACFANGARVVVGTTGWYDKIEEMRAICERRHAALLYGANFSVGIQVMYRLATELVPLVRGYELTISETHHQSKQDAPSGTALAIKQVLLDVDPTLKVEIISYREGEAVGTHTITARHGDDLVKISHEALSRRSFAEGAVRAAEWICGKTGCYDFSQIYPQLQ